MDRGVALAKQYNVNQAIQPIVDFVPAPNSPPLAPKHLTQPSHKSKRTRVVNGEGASVATRSAKRTTADAAPEGEDEDEDVDAIGEDDDDISESGHPSRPNSPAHSEDGSMTSSPSDSSSSSQTPSPYASSAEGGGRPNTETSGRRRDRIAVDPPLQNRHPVPETQNDPAHVTRSFASASTYPPQNQQPYEGRPGPSQTRQAMAPPERWSNIAAHAKYGDIILEYFISDSTSIPSILISPPSDFDANMAIDDDGHTALHWACAMGRVRVVKLLLTAGADIFKVNKAGQTPLMRSVMFANNYDVRKFPELYELLHRSTLNIDNFNRTIFHHVVDLAMSKGKTHAARYYMETLLNRLSDFPQELADIINFQDEDGETALTLAARCRSKRLVKLLLDHGADPKIRNADQKTTEDYILEDERFRYSPVMRGQHLPFKNPSGPNTSGLGGLSAYGPRLYHSAAAQQASGKCTQDMTTMLESLAASFDQELAEKERDLSQAHALLANIQTEVQESKRAVAVLQSQAQSLEQEQVQLESLETEFGNKLNKRFRSGWEKWIKEEEVREKAWQASRTGVVMPVDGANVNGAVPPSPERKTRAGPSHDDLEALYGFAHSTIEQGPVAMATVSIQLRQEIVGRREARKVAFNEFVRLSAEAGTGGRMSEYRRLIGAGCGGVPPDEVDNVIGVLLEVSRINVDLSFSANWPISEQTLEADEGYAPTQAADISPIAVDVA